MTKHPFDRCGLAPLDDLQTQEWRSLFSELEPLQDEFLATRPHSAAYRWPRDPLHTWSRAWEYPYVYHHLRRMGRQPRPSDAPLLTLDFGSGVTFFPFAICRHGFEVICVDQDPICQGGIEQAVARIPTVAGKVSFRRAEGDSLPIPDGSIDALYSVSVLEHTPKHAAIIAEFARVLAPGGLLVLTVDIDLEPGGKAGLGPAAHASLLDNLHQHFDLDYPRLPVHPAAALTNAHSPYANPPSGLRAVWRAAKREILKPALGRGRGAPQGLACEGLVLKRRPRSPDEKRPAAEARCNAETKALT